MDNEDIREQKGAPAEPAPDAALPKSETNSAPAFMEPEETEMLGTEDIEKQDAEPAIAADSPEPDMDAQTSEPVSADADDFSREMQELRERLTQLEHELAAEKDHKVRILADFDNLRKRSARDVQNAIAKATADVVVEFLPVFDHLEMAISHAQEHGSGDGLVEGVSMVLKQFRNTLAKFGIQEIDAMGHTFDPAMHEAMGTAPSEEFPAGIVSKQWQKGFMLGERLIRPCRVVVSAGPGPAKDENPPAPSSMKDAREETSTPEKPDQPN